MGRIIILLIPLIVLSIYSITAFWIGINDITTINSIERLPLLFLPASFVYLFVVVLFASLFFMFGELLQIVKRFSSLLDYK